MFRRGLQQQKMNCFSTALILLVVFLPGVSQSESLKLQFVKEIGVGQGIGNVAWMSFVSFSPDGTMVASDGPTAPEDASSNLTLWSFPEGKLIRSLPVSPTAISRDWKYYAGIHGVWEMETGKQQISVESVDDKAYASYAFSPDSRYVAESLPGIDINNFTHVQPPCLE